MRDCRRFFFRGTSFELRQFSTFLFFFVSATEAPRSGWETLAGIRHRRRMSVTWTTSKIFGAKGKIFNTIPCGKNPIFFQQCFFFAASVRKKNPLKFKKMSTYVVRQLSVDTGWRCADLPADKLKGLISFWDSGELLSAKFLNGCLVTTLSASLTTSTGFCSTTFSSTGSSTRGGAGEDAMIALFKSDSRVAIAELIFGSCDAEVTLLTTRVANKTLRSSKTFEKIRNRRSKKWRVRRVWEGLEGERARGRKDERARRWEGRGRGARG